MSSKSRNQPSKGGAKSKGQPGAVPGVPAAGGSAAPHKGGVLDIPDQYLHVPKKTSPLKFALMIGLIIVLLVIFIVPNAIYSMFGADEQEVEVVAKWTHPEDGELSLTRPDFETAQRRYGSLFQPINRRRFYFSPGETLGLNIGVLDWDTLGVNVNLSYEEIARLLILERLAADAGIVITPQDHLDHLVAYIRQYGTLEDYKRATQRLGNWGAVYFEDALRQALAVERYLVILGAVSALPDPTGIEEFWARDHVETAYDYVELEIASLEEAVRAEAPGDEDLQTWFDELEEIEQNRYLEPERRSVGLVTYRDPETTPATGLLEKYPEPADAVPEDRAGEYYDRVFFDRFLRPEEPETPEEEVDPETDTTEEEEQDPLPTYFTREEVQDQCNVEAPIYFAIDRWLRDLQTRIAEGEEIDLAAEATQLGLAYESTDAPLSVEELGERPELGGFQVAGRAFGTEEGSFASSLVTRDDFFGLLQVTEIVAPAIPPLAEIRDEVVDYWVEKETETRATAQLEAIRAGFEEFVPEAEEDEASDPRRADDDEPRRRVSEADFLAAATGAGFTVQHRGWLDKGGNPTADADRELPAHQFIKSTIEYQDTEVDEVSPVAVDGAGEHVYLVRKSGSREVPIERMTPGQYEQYKAQSQRSAPGDFQRAFDTDYLRQQYGLWLFTDDLEAVEAEGDGGEESADADEGGEDAPSETGDTTDDTTDEG